MNDEARRQARRLDDVEARIASLTPALSGDAATALVRTTTDGAYPTGAAAVFSVLPVAVGGPEVEGFEAVLTPGVGPMYAANVGVGVPDEGSDHIARRVGGRWFFRFDGVDPGLKVTPLEKPSRSFHVKMAAGQFRDAAGDLISVDAVADFTLDGDDTNHVYLDDAGTLSYSTGPYPEAVVHLATVVTSSSPDEQAITEDAGTVTAGTFTLTASGATTDPLTYSAAAGEVALALNSLVPLGGSPLTQTLTLKGSPTGGTFRLSAAGAWTTGLAVTAAAADVRSALLATGVTGVTCLGGPLPAAVVVNFTSGSGVTDRMGTDPSGLTGGTSPSVSVALKPGANVYCVGGVLPGVDILVRFKGSLAGTVAAMTLDATGLTGGTYAVDVVERVESLHDDRSIKGYCLET